MSLGACRIGTGAQPIQASRLQGFPSSTRDNRSLTVRLCYECLVFELVAVMLAPTRILFSLRMEPTPLPHTVAHSDFTDPQGPLLTS